MVNITTVDLLRLATSFPYAYQLQATANASIDHISFISYNDSFANDILGPDASQELVVHAAWEAFHEAGVYNIKTGMLCVCTDLGRLSLGEKGKGRFLSTLHTQA